MTAHSQALRAKPLAFTLAAFFTLIYLACLALALIVPNRELHAPWLQFFPGFAWSLQGMAIGLIESVVYGLFSGAVFAPLYNFFND